MCSHCVVKLHKATEMFLMVDCVWEMTVKSFKYGEYGSFEHCLFLFIYLFIYLFLFCFVLVFLFVVVAVVVVFWEEGGGVGLDQYG